MLSWVKKCPFMFSERDFSALKLKFLRLKRL